MQLCELAKTRLDALLHRLFHNRKITEPDTLTSYSCVPSLRPDSVQSLNLVRGVQLFLLEILLAIVPERK